VEILGKAGKSAQGDGTDAATAVDASAVQLPAPSAPVAVPAVVIPTVGVPAAKVEAKTDAAAADAAAAIGAATGAAAAASAAANGAASAAATDAADAAATIGAATGPAGRAATDAAAEQALGQTGAGETKGQVARKGASGLTATAPSTASGAKSAPSGEAGKGSAPAAAAAGDAPSEHTIHADADAEDKSDPAQPHEKRPVGETTAAKPGETSLRPHVEAQATSDKPPIDAGQITPQQQHPTERSLAPAAAIQAGATAADGPTVPVAGLVVEIAARAQAGGNRFSIRLDPPELGRVDVRLDVDRDGNVTSRLTADKVETLDLLRRDAPQLERALQQAGLKTGDNGMQFSLRDQSAGGQNQNFADNNSRSGAARIVVPDPEMVPVETVRGGYGPSLRVGTGIDIRV
jgi:flagellar hook-length control protein FliK